MNRALFATALLLGCIHLSASAAPRGNPTPSANATPLATPGSPHAYDPRPVPGATSGATPAPTPRLTPGARPTTAAAEKPKQYSEGWYRDRISEINQAEAELTTVLDRCKHHKSAKAKSDCLSEKAFAVSELLGDSSHALGMETWAQTLEILLCLESEGSLLSLACVREKVKAAQGTYVTTRKQLLDSLKKLELNKAVGSVEEGNKLNRHEDSQVVERKASNAPNKKLDDATTAAPAASSIDSASERASSAKSGGAR